MSLSPQKLSSLLLLLFLVFSSQDEILLDSIFGELKPDPFFLKFDFKSVKTPTAEVQSQIKSAFKPEEKDAAFLFVYQKSSPYSQFLAPIVVAGAEFFKKFDLRISFVAVEVGEYANFLEEIGVERKIEMMLIYQGRIINYTSSSVEGLIKFVIKNLIGTVREITHLNELQGQHMVNLTTVLLCTKDRQTSAEKELKKIANKTDLIDVFVCHSDECLNAFREDLLIIHNINATKPTSF